MLRLLRTLSTFEARSGVALRSVGSAGTYLVQHWQQHVRATALSGSDSCIIDCCWKNEVVSSLS